MSKKGGLDVGVMPVDLSRLPYGISFRFEKLVVSESSDPVKLSVNFKEIIKPFYQKRSLFPLRKVFYILIGLSLFTLMSFLIFYFNKR